MPDGLQTILFISHSVQQPDQASDNTEMCSEAVNSTQGFYR